MNVNPLLPLGDTDVRMASFLSPGGLVALPQTTSVSNTRRDGWLRLEVCREYQRKKCPRSADECKYAHPPSHVDQEDGFVVCCYDSLKNNCKRAQPPCKFLHPPEHLKTQLLERGKQNLQTKSGGRSVNVLQTIPMISSPHIQNSHLLPFHILPYLATNNANASSLYPGFLFPYVMNQSADLHHAAPLNNVTLIAQHPQLSNPSQASMITAKLLSLVHQGSNSVSNPITIFDDRNFMHVTGQNSPSESSPNNSTSNSQAAPVNSKTSLSSGKRDSLSGRSLISPPRGASHQNQSGDHVKSTSRSTPSSSPNRFGHNASLAAQTQLAHQLAAAVVAQQNGVLVMSHHANQSQHSQSQQMAPCSLNGLLPTAMMSQHNPTLSHNSSHSTNALNPYALLTAHGQAQMPF